MKYEIQPCSPKARAKLHEANPCPMCNGYQSYADAVGLRDCQCRVNVGIQAAPETGYPFVAMLPGQCFIVPFEGTVEKTIRNRVSVQNKVDERKFVVIKHSEFECYEVARVK